MPDHSQETTVERLLALLEARERRQTDLVEDYGFAFILLFALLLLIFLQLRMNHQMMHRLVFEALTAVRLEAWHAKTKEETTAAATSGGASSSSSSSDSQ
jgi:hypothetical protein